MTDVADKRRPWMKFYPSDWQADEPLQQCSLTSRGLWIEMIAVMHKSTRYGHLLIAGRKPTDAQLATRVGSDAKTVRTCLAELEQWQVFTRDDEGVIFSRRMLKDKRRDDTNAANGKGGGNPALKPPSNPTDNGNDNPSDKPRDNRSDNPPVKAQKPEARKPEEAAKPLAAFSDSREPQPVRDAMTRIFNPSPNDPPTAWVHLADRLPDGIAKVELLDIVPGLGNPICGGMHLNVAAALLCEAAGLGLDWRGDWRLLIGWLRDGLDFHDVILPAVQRVASRPSYQPPSTLRYFESVVREAARRMRA